MDESTEVLSVINRLKQVGCDFLEAENRGRIPEKNQVERVISMIQRLLFPQIFSPFCSQESLLLEIMESLTDITGKPEIAHTFIKLLPDIKEKLLTDVVAMYSGDPAAYSHTEIIRAYPGFYAIFVHRLSHALYLMEVRYLPRMMNEIAHSKTGIDIHPGAEIGDSFCIDHGTGVVIGETARIGNGVKIYQGVTIGAKSFEINENGMIIRGRKRHPDIGNHCVIYANATILGGDTVVGDNSIIGGNVWLVHSVSAGSKVYYNKK